MNDIPDNTNKKGSKPIIEIDSNSGFCFGVVTAIQKAEAELDCTGRLACLGDIVHNASEVERLRLRGLHTITHEDLVNLHDCTVLLRAHGEPPSTYAMLKKNHISVIDATCPVVLRLQKRIKHAYNKAIEECKTNDQREMPLFLIYGKTGHAEVNGLVGQTEGNAVVIQSIGDLDSLDLSRDIFLYSQTTKSIEGFQQIVNEIEKRKKSGNFEYFDTICRQVANRSDKIRGFAETHDTILFVTGAKSSNGKVLFEECRKVNPRTYAVTDGSGINPEWLAGAESIGICGATSTPAWLMKEVAEHARLITKS
ncbi:MAG: 4-hydroxy-3-methylbut-2-enyl diphosphate reductase [Candidatus Amulumruptor caecigallinarius]|nr:4-hydroxy-3-methylbut-2-enyl diphosphate reductase [Candidatus Amulumruptor caecigallinarius]